MLRCGFTSETEGQSEVQGDGYSLRLTLFLSPFNRKSLCQPSLKKCVRGKFLKALPLFYLHRCHTPSMLIMLTFPLRLTGYSSLSLSSIQLVSGQPRKLCSADCRRHQLLHHREGLVCSNAAGELIKTITQKSKSSLTPAAVHRTATTSRTAPSCD